MPIDFKDSIHVDGDIKASNAFIDSTNSAGTSGQVLSSTATGTDWITLPSTGVAWGGITGILSNQTDLQNALNAKQATLISGTNIKTVNSTTILGSGNLAVQEVLVSATNIKTVNGSTLLGSGNLVVSGSITITDNTANNVLTATGTQTLSGESKFTFDDSTGTVIGGVSATIGTSTINQGVSGIYDDLNSWGNAFASGEIMKNQPVGEAIALGECVVLVDGPFWMKSDQTNSLKSTHMLGIALQTTDGEEGIDILIAGFVETTEIEDAGIKNGWPLYLREETPGEISHNIPTSGFVRLVGYSYQNTTSQANSKFILRFDPDNTWVEL